MSGMLRRYADEAIAKAMLAAAAAGLALVGVLFGAFAIYRHFAVQLGDVQAAAIVSVCLLALGGAIGAIGLHRGQVEPPPASPPAPASETVETLLAHLIAGDAPAAPLARVGLALLAGMLAGARAPKK